MTPPDWMPYRRSSDREHVGYLRMVDDSFEPLTLFGYSLGEPTELEDAEAVLDERGLAVLADRWTLTRPDGRRVAVRISEVNPDRVRVVEDDLGGATAVGATMAATTLPVPVPSTVLALGD